MMRTPFLLLVLLAFVPLFAACSDDPTQIVVVTDTDLRIPTDLDAIGISVTSPGGDVATAMAPVTGASSVPLPHYTALTYEKGSLGPFVIVATGLLDGNVVVSRTARVSFVSGKILRLVMTLDRACPGGECADLSDADLDPWTGPPPALDSGMPLPRDMGTDGPAIVDLGVDMVTLDACVPSLEICNGVDDDCDGLMDEGPASSLCDSRPSSVVTCTEGLCRYSCSVGFLDCPGSAPEDGCETRIDADNCGSCGADCQAGEFCAVSGTTYVCTTTCSDPNTLCGGTACVNTDNTPQYCGSCTNDCTELENVSSAGCLSGACFIADCTTNRENCNGMVGDGCETNITSSATHCGECGNNCNMKPQVATATCGGGVCNVTMCNGGFADCDMTGGNGCEVNTRTNENHCGTCGKVCDSLDGVNAANVNCQSGLCTSTSGSGTTAGCSAGFGNCDNNLHSNGCETPLDTATDCGTCGNACPALAGATAMCSSGECVYMCTGAGTLCGTDGDRVCANVNTDEDHCGACDKSCSELANVDESSVECRGGACSSTAGPGPVDACDDGHADCDADLHSNGCEHAIAAVGDPMNCGPCADAAAPSVGIDCADASGDDADPFVCCEGRCVAGASCPP
jgi:hypothetical protein